MAFVYGPPHMCDYTGSSYIVYRLVLLAIVPVSYCCVTNHLTTTFIITDMSVDWLELDLLKQSLAGTVLLFTASLWVGCCGSGPHISLLILLSIS